MHKSGILILGGCLVSQLMCSGCGREYFSVQRAALMAGSPSALDPAGSAEVTGESPDKPSPASPPVQLSCHDIRSCSCGTNQIWICHIPLGNPAAQNTLCIDIDGAVNGHGITFDGKPGGHGGDYPGSCQAQSGGSAQQ